LCSRTFIGEGIVSQDKKKASGSTRRGRSSREQGEEDREHLYDDWDELPPEVEASRLKRLEGLVPDILRRSLTSGIGSAFMSEDGIRSMLADTKLPKEVVNYLIAQADSTKREFFRIASREIREFLENVDFGGELTKILTSVSFEIRTEVRFIPNDSAVKPNVRNRVAVRKADGTEEVLSDELGDEASAADDGGSGERRKGRWKNLRSRGETGEEDEE
jgi:hypothetical protein